jgi:uncharacterized membrane protein YhhN
LTTLLGLLALASGSAHIVADYRQAWRATYVLKPLTMVAIIAIVLLPPGPYPGWRVWILAGLGFSVIGDVLLMLRPARFPAGLAAFLCGHLAYSGAFLAAGAVPWWPSLLPSLAAGLGMAGLLWRGLGALRTAVILYIMAISLMVWLALSLWWTLGHPAAGGLAAGAVLFMFSDAVLGYARFRRRFRAAQAIILGSYYTGQWLIALGAWTLNQSLPGAA